MRRIDPSEVLEKQRHPNLETLPIPAEIREYFDQLSVADKTLVRLAYGVQTLFRLPPQEQNPAPSSPDEVLHNAHAYLSRSIPSRGRLTDGFSEPALAKRLPIDALVSERIAALTQQSAKPNILEIGCGLSYGAGISNDGGIPQVAEPWLARFLQEEHGDAIHLIATDSSPAYARITVTPQGMLRFGLPLPHFDPEMRTADNAHTLAQIHTILKQNNWRSLALQRTAQNKPSFPPASTKLLQQLEQVSPGTLPQTHTQTGETYIRPSLDPAFEKIVFGLTTRRGIDAHTLPSHFPDKKFRMIFGRNLPLQDGSFTAWDPEKIARSLTPDGELILQIDPKDEGGAAAETYILHYTMRNGTLHQKSS